MFGGFKHAAYGRSYHHARHFGGWGRRPKYNVPVNIADKDTYYEVSVYATGFDKENIKLKISGNELFISGTRHVDETEIPTFVKQEFPVRVFERVISLGDGIDVEAITARQENNVLYISLPKNAAAQNDGREIQVN